MAVLKYRDPDTGEFVEVPQAVASGYATKEYVNAADLLKVNKAGDTMTGPLIIGRPDDGTTLEIKPSGTLASKVVLGASDGGVLLRTIGTPSDMSLLKFDGSAYAKLRLADPTVAYHAATKQYVDGLGNVSTWTPTPTGFTLTASACYYIRINRLVFLQGLLTIGSVTGSMSIALPTAISSGGAYTVGGFAIGRVRYINASNSYMGTCLAAASALNFYATESPLAAAGPTAPFTWASGNTLQFSVVYPSANSN